MKTTEELAAQIGLPPVDEARMEQIRADILDVLKVHRATPWEARNVWESREGTLLEHFCQFFGPIHVGGDDAGSLSAWMQRPLPEPETCEAN